MDFIFNYKSGNLAVYLHMLLLFREKQHSNAPLNSFSLKNKTLVLGLYIYVGF